MRKTFKETINVLKQVGLVYDDQSPRLPKAMPKFDDTDPCGFSVFRIGIENMDLSNLDMRRTFFSKSEVARCTLKNTDLQESNLCWNDFIGVDFTGANLSYSDLRASIYKNVDFTECNLSGADLRQADFNNCTFTSAKMKGVKLTQATGAIISLSQEQKEEIDWQTTEGNEPSGG